MCYKKALESFGMTHAGLKCFLNYNNRTAKLRILLDMLLTEIVNNAKTHLIS